MLLSDIFNKPYKYAIAVRDGYAFNDLNEAKTFNCAVKIDQFPKIIKDHRERELVDGTSLKMQGELLNPTLAELIMAYGISKGNHSLALHGKDGNLEFIANTNLTGAPNGSQLAGLNFKYQRTNTESSLALNWEALLLRSEVEWMESRYSNSFGDGVSSERVTPALPCFREITMADISIPVFGDPNFSISSVAQRKDYRDRPINRFLSVVVSFVAPQKLVNDLLYSVSTGLSNYTPISLFTEDGLEYRFSDAPVSLSPAIELSEKEFFQHVKIIGRLPYNQFEHKPEYIDFGIRQKNVIEFRFM